MISFTITIDLTTEELKALIRTAYHNADLTLRHLPGQEFSLDHQLRWMLRGAIQEQQRIQQNRDRLVRLTAVNFDHVAVPEWLKEKPNA